MDWQKNPRGGESFAPKIRINPRKEKPLTARTIRGNWITPEGEQLVVNREINNMSILPNVLQFAHRLAAIYM
jgi:hypothetical protein